MLTGGCENDYMGQIHLFFMRSVVKERPHTRAMMIPSIGAASWSSRSLGNIQHSTFNIQHPRNVPKGSVLPISLSNARPHPDPATKAGSPRGEGEVVSASWRCGNAGFAQVQGFSTRILSGYSPHGPEHRPVARPIANRTPTSRGGARRSNHAVHGPDARTHGFQFLPAS